MVKSSPHYLTNFLHNLKDVGHSIQLFPFIRL